MEREIKYRNYELGSDMLNSFLLYTKQSIYCFSMHNIAYNLSDNSPGLRVN
jgi:hypothetical protein